MSGAPPPPPLPGAQKVPPPLPTGALKPKKKTWAKVGERDESLVFDFEPHALEAAPLDDFSQLIERTQGVHYMQGAGDGSSGAFAVVLGPEVGTGGGQKNQAGNVYVNV